MTKPKSSESSIVVPPVFAEHLLNGAQFLNATGILSLLCFR